MATSSTIAPPTSDLVLAGNIGSNLDKADTNLMAAYNLAETDKDGIAKLAADMKLPDLGKDDKGNAIVYTLEAVQAAAQRVYDRASSSYVALTNIFRSKKQALDAVIQNIR